MSLKSSVFSSFISSPHQPQLMLSIEYKRYLSLYHRGVTENTNSPHIQKIEGKKKYLLKVKSKTLITVNFRKRKGYLHCFLYTSQNNKVISPKNAQQENNMNILNTDVHPDDNFTVSLRKRLNLCLLMIIITLATSGTLWIDIKLLGNTISENSLTEISEQTLLLLSALSFAWLARTHQHLRAVAQLIGSFFAVMLIRELDKWFDIIQHGAWFYPAMLTTIISIAYALKHKSEFKPQMATFLKSGHMAQLVVGTMMLLISSRLFGMSELWQAIMGDNYIRAVKNAVEEGSELFSYYMIATAAIGTAYSLHRQQLSQAGN